MLNAPASVDFVVIQEVLGLPTTYDIQSVIGKDVIETYDDQVEILNQIYGHEGSV